MQIVGEIPSRKHQTKNRACGVGQVEDHQTYKHEALLVQLQVPSKKKMENLKIPSQVYAGKKSFTSEVLQRT
jgi:hypothetical protein